MEDTLELDLDPISIARRYIKLTHANVSDLDFYIRDDSYHDSSNHNDYVFARQRINGLDVVDGDFNLVIRNAQVITFGDSVSFWATD